MAKITLEVPDELSEQLLQMGDRLPELLALSLSSPQLGLSKIKNILDLSNNYYKQG